MPRPTRKTVYASGGLWWRKSVELVWLVATLERLYCSRISILLQVSALLLTQAAALELADLDQSARGPRPIESLQDGGGGRWLVLVGHMRVDGPVVRRKLNIGGIPTHTGADELEVCAG
ncbi:hypothetical protein IFM61392_02951 [Aspergillus lentulus]|nr:hypothetical protein IFM62136_02997 [Aspergillus lentulus]GFF69646.1 hypothetical protein IFM47457_02438 [Aspergillus lentulus]GFG03720.1 hypothetical protein IFM61392_02951 [Aspergillus lentulus]